MDDFESRIIKAVDAFFKSYPDPENNLKIDRLLLRYIDAIDFNFKKKNIFEFLDNQLKTKIKFYSKLFENTGINKSPTGLDLTFSFASEEPTATVHVRFVQGKRRDSNALIWETMVESVTTNTPESQKEIAEWIDKAHEVTDDWFFKLIEGDLLRRCE